MVSLLVLTFLISMIAMWTEKPYGEKCRIRIGWIIIISLLLAVLASIRSDKMPDYTAYFRIFDFPTSAINERIEPGFKWFILIIKYLLSNNFIVFLFCSAFCSIIIKLLAVKQLSNLFYTSLFIYISSKYISNDLIQMRVAFSTGLLLFAIIYKNKNQLFPFLIVTTLAFLFHYSAILLYFIWFIPTDRINKYLYIILVIGSYILALSGLSLAGFISYVPVLGIQDLYTHYTDVVQTSEANLFSILLISKLAICIYFLYTYDKYTKHSPYFIISVKLFAISLIAYCLLFSINAVAVRIAELFQIVEIILIPFLYYFSKNRIVGKAMITAIGMIYFIFYVNFSGWFPD